MSSAILAVVIYLVSLLFIVFERVDKAIVALTGALLLIVSGILTPHQAIEAIDFETIWLLMGMMMIIYISQKSGIFNWLSTNLAKVTKGNPLVIFILFISGTALFSAFLDNVTTILIVVPITIAITQGLGLNTKVFVISEIMFSNIGGALTLIGDPPNILIGGHTKFSFNQFIVNLWLPVSVSLFFILGTLALFHWKEIKPIKNNLTKLFLAHLLIKKISHKFYKQVLKKSFIIKVLTVLLFTILGFVLQTSFHLPVGIVAMCGAMILLLVTTDHVNLHETFNKVEWPTLFFFAGLFILTGGLKESGVLNAISHSVVALTHNPAYLLLIILWLSGLVSMLVDNIPFVMVMLPIVSQIEPIFPDEKVQLLYWALSLGACFGGNGTIIGASANVVGVSLANKAGIKINFWDYFKTAFPLTLITLGISSVYLMLRLNW